MGKNPTLNIIFNFSLLEFPLTFENYTKSQLPKLEGWNVETFGNSRKTETFSNDFQTLCALALFCDTEFHQLFTVLC